MITGSNELYCFPEPLNETQADMARDLAPEVEKLIRGNNSYLRKKVRYDCVYCYVVCMGRIVNADLLFGIDVGGKIHRARWH